MLGLVIITMMMTVRYVQCCSKCLYCNKISAKCECTEEDKVRGTNSTVTWTGSCLKAKDPVDVMYGWCQKCRAKYKEEYEDLVG